MTTDRAERRICYERGRGLGDHFGSHHSPILETFVDDQTVSGGKHVSNGYIA